ncbi:hypothetical protein A3B19_02080 [Candidatus Giovannonibacteria bacterium RIFCSPLOWO2_01_FULL_46_32]|uniref:VTT domain-containing protein n=1 Tax=Candidatus Giovannonibacteria bacterium RIFCSPLOWO2_01_FULL_46_32 TaxID=1798353 RepID=A0A1F5XIL3_9BACT|nr:MAG: hypothetical protein A3B19_02080 [Candidatus Giovannonibacteria bacterium RIFCSPLOWO2_01_FULL_46_32]
MEFLAGWDLVSLIKAAGYAGLFVIVFAESGLFIGFFLPGDSLLFTAGFLASQGFLNIWALAPLVFSAAILGDNFGYAFGKKVGPAIFSREDSWLFHKDHMERARIFYEKHGAKTLVLARFLPVARTFAPILAGVGRMHYPTFFFYNILGAAFWALGVTWLGYFLGATIPGVDKYLIPIILVIIVVSILPTLIHIIKNKEYIIAKRK